MMTYAERTTVPNTDGTPLFCNDHDKQNEDDLATILGKRWRCQLHAFGNLSPIDFYAIRDGRMVGVIELKSRQHESTKYPTVFLNVRKWLCLGLAETGLGCPAVFVVRFLDGIRYIPFSRIDASKVTIGGCAKRIKSRTDIEPVIEVSVRDMMSI